MDLSVTDALSLVMAECVPLGPERVPLFASAGRVAATSVRAAIDAPGFDNSQMDGYALAFAGETAEPNAWFHVIGALPAGSQQELRLAVGEAARVFTGSPLPEGTAAVAMQEVVTAEGPRITLTQGAKRGQFMRLRGSDIRAGTEAIPAGAVLGPAAIGLLTNLGNTEVEVYRRPRVGLFTSGDELVAPGSMPGRGQLIESNGWMLAAFCDQFGLEPPVSARARDDATAMRAALAPLLESCDVVLITGGVSVGEHDHVKAVLESLGVRQVFWRVAQRPGKPMVFGVKGRTLVFGLPGNPVSTLACAYVYVWPAIRALMGHTHPHLPRREGWLAGPIPGIASMTQFVRATSEGERVRPLGAQGSHQLSAFALADALVIVPPREGSYAQGERVDYIPLP